MGSGRTIHQNSDVAQNDKAQETLTSYFQDDCGCGCFLAETCSTDADCPKGYCEHYATCDAEGCPPAPPSQCIAVNCDEPTEVMCDALPPTCPPGEVAAARNGCWECVDARTCLPSNVDG